MKKYLIFCFMMMGTAVAIMLSGITLPTILALIVLVVAVLMDDFTTWRALKLGFKEQNPIVAFLFKRISVPGTFLVMLGCWAVFICLVWMKTSENQQTALACAYWLVPINNMMLLRKAAKNKKKEG